jgi:prevent-host-death family protein
MVTVGVSELKQQTNKILRRVREKGEIVEITYHGETMARLIPTHLPAVEVDDTVEIWPGLDQLTAEIGAKWPKGVTAVEAVREARRDL